MNDNNTPIDLISIALGNTAIESEIMRHPVLGRIVSIMPRVPFEIIKKEEMYMHNDQYKLKIFNKGKEDERDPKVTNPEKYIYINRILASVAEKIDSGIADIYGELYYYNHYMWVKMTEQTASNFISLIGKRAGLYTSFVSDFRVKKTMYKQLNADLSIPEENLNTSEDHVLAIANLKNGTLKITEDGDVVLHEFSKNDYLRYQLGYEYNPEATSPLFDDFLDEVLPEKAAQDLLMEMIGYCFIPTQKMKLERSLMLYGPGANGKGVVFEIVVAILGEEHVSGFSMEALSCDANARAQLKDKLLNYATELGGNCNPDMIKKLISGEPVHVKTLYKDVTMMKNYSCKFIFNTNSLPRGAENTNAFFRRWEILPFDVEIPPEKRDIHLSRKLKAELPGIFNRVLEGIKRLIKNKDFTESQLAKKMLEEYKEQSNSVLRFIKEEEWMPTVEKNTSDKISSEVPHILLKELYQQYKKYCEQSGCTASSKVDFGRKIRKNFLVQEKCTNNETWVFAKTNNHQLTAIKQNCEIEYSSEDIINKVLRSISNEKDND